MQSIPGHTLANYSDYFLLFLDFLFKFGFNFFTYPPKSDLLKKSKMIFFLLFQENQEND